MIQHILVLDLAQVCKWNEKINNHLNLLMYIKKFYLFSSNPKVEFIDGVWLSDFLYGEIWFRLKLILEVLLVKLFIRPLLEDSKLQSPFFLFWQKRIIVNYYTKKLNNYHFFRESISPVRTDRILEIAYGRTRTTTGNFVTLNQFIGG